MSCLFVCVVWFKVVHFHDCCISNIECKILFCLPLLGHGNKAVNVHCDAVTGMQAYADALLIIPKVLAQNSGMDQQEIIVKLQEEYRSAGQPVGLDISTGKLYSCHFQISHFCLTSLHLLYTHCIYTVFRKKGATIFSTVTLAFLSQFF